MQQCFAIFGKLPQWNLHVICHVNGATFQSGLRFKTGLNSLRVSCKHALKEIFNKMEVEIDSGNKSQLKRIRKAPLFLSQDEKLNHWPKKLRNNLACLTRVKKLTKKQTFFKKFPYPKSLFSHFDHFFFEVFKTEITSCQTLCCLS